MFRRDFKDNLKNEIMRDERIFSDMFNLIEVIIDFDDKLYKRAIKKNTINFEKKQESSLNQRSNISKKNLVLTRSIVIPIIVSLHL